MENSKVTETGVENPEVMDTAAENNSEISVIPVENNSESSVVPVENNSEVSEQHVEDNSEISEIPVEHSEIMDIVVEDNFELSEIPVEDNNSEISAIPLEDSEVTDMAVEVEEEDSEVVQLLLQLADDDDDDENNKNEPVKLNRLPVAKIKRIMKNALGETGINIVSSESAFLVGQATELFISALAEQAAAMARGSKKKTITPQHLKTTIREAEVFSFLEGTLIPDYDF